MIESQNGQRNLDDKLISITAPALNEEKNLKELCDRIGKSVGEISENYEIVIVDNGSSDNSNSVLRQLNKTDPRIKYVQLSRNFGHQGGLIAGMEHCSGDIIISMDADLQHPPEVLLELLKEWCNGFDVVGTIKRSNSHTGLLRNLLNKVFYQGLGRFIGIPLSAHQSDFRLLDRAALEALIALPEKDKFLRGLTHWIGFTQTSIEFDAAPRFAGETKFNFFMLISFAIHGIISFSSFPLRILSVLGGLIALISFIIGIAHLIGWAFNMYETPPSGWLTLAVGIHFLGGLQLIGLGLLGEYLGQTLIETRRRPSFIVRESTAQHVNARSANRSAL